MMDNEMDLKSTKNSMEARLKMFFGLAALLWILLLVVVAAWHVRQASQEAMHLAQAEVHDAYASEVAAHLWLGMAEKVYVLPPHEPGSQSHRESSTRKKDLLLLTPERNDGSDTAATNGRPRTRMHLVSLDTLRYGHKPDEWERAAFLSFQKGDTEVSALETINEETQLRLMKPLVMEGRCMKCHDGSGSRLGEMRGGISVSIPWKRFSDGIMIQVWTNFLVFGALAILGVAAILLFRKRLLQSWAQNKIVEESLRMSEESYRALVEMSPDAIAIYADGVFLFANVRMSALLGARLPADIIGKPLAEFLPPSIVKFVELCEKDFHNALLVPALCEQKLHRLDGIVMDVEVDAVHFKYNGKECIQVILRNITNRIERNRSIHLMAHALASTKDAVSITDLEDNVLFVNDAFVQCYGFSKEEIIGKNVSILRSALTSEEIGSQIRPATLTTGWNGEIYNRRKDGTDFPVELWSSVVRSDDGEPVAMVGVARDISERKLAEKVTQTLNEISRGTNVSETLAELFEDIHRQLSGLIDARNFFIALINDAGDSISFPYDADENGSNTSTVIQLDDPTSLTAEVIRTTRPLLLDVMQLKERYESGKNRLWGVAPKCWLGVPLMVGDKVIGAMAVQSYDRNDIYHQQDVVLFESTAAHVANAIDRKRVEEERKQAEAALYRSEELFRGLFANMLNGLAYCKIVFANGRPQDFVYLTVNAAFETITGLKDVIGKNVTEVIPGVKQTDPQMFEMFVRVALSGTAESREIYVESINAWLAISAYSPSKDHFVSIYEDITERKRAEEALNRSREDFQGLFNDAPVGYHEIDSEGRIVRINNMDLALLGYGRDEIIGKPIWEFSADPDHSRQAVHAKLSGENVPTQPYERTFIRKDGTSVAVLVEDDILRRKDGTVAGIRTAMQDITERKRVEEILRLSEERFRLLAASAQDGIIVIDDDGIVTYWNRAAEDMFGYSAEEAEGQNAHSLFMPEGYRLDQEKAFQRFKDEGVGDILGKRVEVTAKKKDGTEFYAELSISCLDIKGRRHALGLVRDVTQNKKAREELARYTEELFQAKSSMEKQAQRLQLQADDLREAREVAVEASRLKSEFVANMSHEIRTPMNGVIGMTDLLLGTGLSEEQREYVEIIHSSGETLLGVINDILDFSKIESGQMTCETIDFDIRATAEEAANVMALRAQEKEVELLCFVHPDVPHVLQGDQTKLRQVLVNLIGNAVKFTEHGEIEVKVVVESEVDEKVVVRFDVKDSGIGIPEDKQEKVFQSFVQADGSVTRKYGGTGLGLAICKRLVDLMGGTIGLHSKKGEGSTFWFSIPFEKGEISSAKKPDDISGTRCLVVDDNDTNRKILRYTLESWGLTVHCVSSGAEALSILQADQPERPFDVAILDMQMPEMNGLELARHIRADQRVSGLPLLMLSSMGSARAEAVAGLGIEAILTKPVRQAQLRDVLVRILQRDMRGTNYVPRRMEMNETNPAQQQGEFANLQILVAEDNKVNQKIAAKMFGKLGCSIDIAEDGAEAIQCIQKKKYAIVFMDCHMPVVDGYKATMDIRLSETPGNRTIIVAMTANALESDRELCIAAGMDDYIAKPVKLEGLVQMLRRWTRRTEHPPKDTQGETPAELKPVSVDHERIESLKELGDGAGSSWLQSVFGAFMSDAEKRLVEMMEACVSQDHAALKVLAHTMKGSSRNIGAVAMGEISQSIESLTKSGSVEGCRDMIRDLEAEFRKVCEILEAEMQSQQADL